MVWSQWKGAAALMILAGAGLACAGLVYSQPTAPRPSTAGADPSKTVMIEEPGKGKMECLVLKTYRLSNGQLAHDVKVRATGETMTIVDPNAASETKVGLTGLPPPNLGKQQPGQPLEYVEERLVPGTMPAMAAVGDTSAPTAFPSEFRTIQEAGKPPQKCRVLNKWQMADGAEACQCQAQDSGEMVTIVEGGPAHAVPGSKPGGHVLAKVSEIFHWGRSTTPPPGVPVPPPEMMVAQPIKNATPAPLAIVPPPQAIAVETVKPKFSDRIKDLVGNLFPAQQPVQVAKAPEQPVDLPKLPQVVKVPEPIKAANPLPPVPAKAKEPTLPTSDLHGPTIGKAPVDATLAPYSRPLSSPPAVPPLPTEPSPASAPAPLPASPLPPAAAWTPPQPAAGKITKPAQPATISELPTSPLWSQPAAVPTPPAPPQTAGVDTTPGLPPGSAMSPPAAVPVPPTPTPPAAATTTPALPPGSPSSPTAPVPVLPMPTQPTGANIFGPAQASVQPPLPASAQVLPVSKAEVLKPNDPLADPANFVRSGAVDKAPAIKELATAPKDASGQPLAGSPSATGSGLKVPPGAASVMAAANGGNPGYLPVPIMTVPPSFPSRPPMASLPQPPATAPDPTWYVNAFTPPQPANAAWQAAAMQQQMAQQRMMMPMMPAAYYPGTGYANPMMMAQWQTPSYYMPMGYQPMAYAPAPMMPYNMGPGRGTVPAMYQGPMPPNPVAYNGYTQMPYANAAMDRPGMMTGNASIYQTVQMLQSSLYPAQREIAANNLASYDWRACPQVVMWLTMAAREDPAATVRCACVFALARMGVNTDVVVQTLNQLRADNDPRVRQEAERALARLYGQS